MGWKDAPLVEKPNGAAGVGPAGTADSAAPAWQSAPLVSAPVTPAESANAPAVAPKQPDAPPTMDVVRNAAYGGAAAIPDAILNAPNQVMNLGKAAFGTGATALGRPDLAPDITPDPNYVQKLLEKIGLTKPGVTPQGAQKALDVLIRGGVGGALTGGASVPQALAGAGMGALATGAGAGTEGTVRALGGSDSLAAALGNTAGLLAPKGAAALASIPRIATERNASIPPERLDAYKAMAEKGARPQGSALIFGEANKNIVGQQRVANEVYNESVGLPKKSDFGAAEIKQAKSNLSGDYQRLLTGREITLDKPLFDRVKTLYDEQSGLSRSGAMFTEARPIIDALEKTMQASQTGTGTMDAIAYNKLRSILGQDAQRAKADPERATLLRKTQQAFDQAADRSMPDIAPELSATRGKYENLMILSDAMVGKGAGHITPAEVGRKIAQRSGQRSLEPAQTPLKELGQQGLSLSGDKAADNVNLSGVATHIPKVGISMNAIKRALETPITAARARGMASPTYYQVAKEREALLKAAAARSAIPLSANQTDNN